MNTQEWIELAKVALRGAAEAAQREADKALAKGDMEEVQAQEAFSKYLKNILDQAPKA